MGIDDRDYMRERYRQRQGLPPERTTWNERKARRELEGRGYQKAVPVDRGWRSVPLGSALWISGNGKRQSWFERKNRGHNYQRGRWRPSRRARFPSGLIALSLTTAIIATGFGARDWIAERYSAIILAQGHSFPASGTVSVPANIDMKRVVAKLTVQGGVENAIVQMIDAKSGRNALSVYVRAHERVTVPAPVGRFHMRLVHGREWSDAQTLFGKGTLHDEVDGVMRFSRKVGHVLDLRLGHDSNLVVRRINLRPAPLA
ncbi:hypothetical protein ACVOMT_23860 (plasmid) [Sphingomonas panni]